MMGASESDPIRMRTEISDMKRLSSDVTAILHPVERHRRDTGIGAFDGSVVGRPAADNRQYTSPGGHHLSVVPGCGRRMKYQDVVERRDAIETCDRHARGTGTWISARREDDANVL